MDNIIEQLKPKQRVETEGVCICALYGMSVPQLVNIVIALLEENRRLREGEKYEKF